MPFINETDRRTAFQESMPDMNIAAPGFGETFAAAVGTTIDENLSISQSLNREGWQNRQELIKQRIDEDVLNRDDYMDRRGRFDYNRAATDLNDPSIKTDQVLEQERREMLAGRRKYADDVIARGNGMAQFLGMANAYMLDPISIATMPIALPATTAKSLSIAGRALLTARNAAVIEGATELAIQPFVYEHKQDIESPYTYKDALVNIAGAALGASVLGGVAGGVSGYLRSVRKAVADGGVITPEVESALENIARMEDTLSNIPEGDMSTAISKAQANEMGLIEAELVESVRRAKSDLKKAAIAETDELALIKSELEVSAAEKISRGDVKGIKKEIHELDYSISKLDEKHDYKALAREKLGKKAKIKEVLSLAKDIKAKDATGIEFRRDYLRAQLESQTTAKAAQADLSRMRQGKTPERFISRINKAKSKAAVDVEIDFLETMEVKREMYRRPTTEPSHYERPQQTPPKKAKTAEREAAILADSGDADNFHRDMQRFSEIDEPVFYRDGDFVDGSEAMKALDDELEGIDSVLTCAYG